MNIRRVLILLGNEIINGPKNFIFIMALAMPVIFTLAVSLIFGSVFSGRSRLGIVDLGGSQLVTLAQGNQSLIVRSFNSLSELQLEVETGGVDMGVILPNDFDAKVVAKEMVKLTVYVWGESHLQNRLITSAALIHGMRQIAGQAAPVEIVQEVLGTGTNVPWEKRLLPVMVMMTVLLSGMMTPSTSLVNEKVKRTFTALSISPATLPEVYAAKGLLGTLLSIFTGVLILFLNQAFGDQPLLLVGVLALGAMFSATIGVLVGALLKDITTLFALYKSTGIVLYAPAIFYLFPDLPQWIGRVFPTYYIIAPVMEISQHGARFADVLPDLVVLVALIGLFWAILLWVAKKQTE